MEDTVLEGGAGLVWLVWREAAVSLTAALVIEHAVLPGGGGQGAGQGRVGAPPLHYVDHLGPGGQEDREE